MKKKYQYPQQTRRRTPKNIIEEIKIINKRGQLKIVSFTDSLFTSDKKWVMEVLKKYQKNINIPFICFGHYNFLDEEIIKELKRSNCLYVSIGAESGDDYIRNKVLNKHLSTSKIIRVAKLLHKHKLKFLCLNMMGLPGETFEQAMKTIKLNQKIKPDFVTTYMLMNYPETTITDYALKHEFLTKEKLKESSLEKYKRMRSVLINKEGRKISNLQKFSGILIRHPLLKLIVMQLIKLPENKVFDYIYFISETYQMKSMRRFDRKEIIERVFRHSLHHFIKSIRKLYTVA